MCSVCLLCSVMHKEEGSCSFVFRLIGNYQKFYSAIKAAYPEVNIISSCDRSTISPSNPADLYDVHVMSLCYFLGCLSKNFTMVDKKHHLWGCRSTPLRVICFPELVCLTTHHVVRPRFILMLSVYRNVLFQNLTHRNDGEILWLFRQLLASMLWLGMMLAKEHW